VSEDDPSSRIAARVEETHKVQAQIEKTLDLAGLGDDERALFRAIMLAGHDGSHPHLPDIDDERAELLLNLVRDLMREIYTRPAQIRRAGTLRQAAIARSRGTSHV
jgi:hypothetical protein